MAKARNQPNGSDANLLWAACGLVACSLIGAIGVYLLSSFVLDSFQDSNSMALLITDAGTKSDDKNLERNLSSATLALKMCRDLGWALAVGCLGVGVAAFLRSRR